MWPNKSAVNVSRGSHRSRNKLRSRLVGLGGRRKRADVAGNVALDRRLGKQGKGE